MNPSMSQPYSMSPSQGMMAAPPAPPPKLHGASVAAREVPFNSANPVMHSSNQPSELAAGQSPPAQQQWAPAQPPRPNIESDWLPDFLKDKSTQDLQHFLATPALHAACLSDRRTTHPAVSDSESYVVPLINSNLSLAASTSELEARLQVLRERAQSRLLTLRALEQQHRMKIAETEDALRDFSPMALYQRLSASVQEQNLLVRGLEDSWLEEEGVASDRDLGDFVKKTKDARKVAFLRKERKNRWDEGRVGGWR